MTGWEGAVASSAALNSVDDVRTFIDEYFKAWQGTDDDRILSYYTETVYLEIPGMVIHGKAALRDQFVRPFIAGFPGNRHIVKSMMFGKDVVVVEWSLRSRSQRPIRRPRRNRRRSEAARLRGV